MGRTSADQHGEFLEALDVSFLLRKAATVSTPLMEISEDAGTWNIKTSTTLKTMELKFKLDEQFDETTPDGREVSAKGTRELIDGELVYTMTIEGNADLKCVQKFKRL